MDGERDGRGWLRPSFHLYLLAFTLTIFFIQIPLGVFAAQSPLDSTAHVLMPAAATSLLYDAVYRQVVHSPFQYYCTMVLLGVSCEMVWECIEFTLDAIWHLGWQVDNADTMNDIICGIVGALAGAGIRLWIWLRTRPRDEDDEARRARPRFYYRRSRRTDGGVAYEGLWVAGLAGSWCADRHPSIVEAERCARDRWWRDHGWAARAGVRPAAAWLRALARVPATWARRLGRIRPTTGRKIGLVGAAIVVALAPSGYVGYLAWATPVAHALPAVVPGAAAPGVAAPAVPAPTVPPSVAAAELAAPASAESAPDDAEGPRDPEPTPPAVAASVPIPSLGAAIPVGPTPGFVVVAPNGRQAYVANRAAGVVTVVDTAVDKVTATIPVPAGPPQYLAFSPDGRRVYISIWNDARTIAAIGVLDTTTNSVVATVPVGTRPFLAAVTPDGRQLFVPNHDSGTISVIDTTTYAVTSQIRVAANPHWVEFSRDGRRAYVADHESNVVSVIDTATDAVVAEVPVRRSPHSVAVHPTRPLVADADYDADCVTMIDTRTEQVVATVPVGHGPQDVTWAPDGRFAYVADVDADSVSVIDAATMAVTATIPTGHAPTSIAVLPNGRQAYVTNLHDGTVTVLYVGA